MNTHRVRSLLAAFLVSLVTAFLCVASSPQSDGKVGPTSLPDIMIAYGSLLSSDGEAGSKEIADRVNSFPLMAKLNSELDQLGVRIPECLLFSHRSFIVQTAFEGQSYGFPRHDQSESEAPFTNLLFVSTPIDKLDRKVLVVLSCVRPEKTKVFTLDSNLHPELLYDTDRAPADNGKFVEPLRSVYQIRVLGDARLLLRERVNKSVPPQMGVPSRSFLFEIRNGKPEISPMKSAGKSSKE